MSEKTVTYSKNVFLPLTHVCANACGYCSFKEPVGPGCVMPKQEVLATLQRGAQFGCTEALFTFGERPGLERGFTAYVRELGYDTILDYCYAMCEKAITLGMLPHTNAGILTYEELRRFRKVNASMGLMLETTAEIPAHEHSPGKRPEVRIEMLENAGRLKIPFTTGLLLGIGETRDDRIDSLNVIADIAKRYGHIQEVIIQNFCPKEGTVMACVPGASIEILADTLRLAAEILPSSVSVQIPPNLADAGALLSLGVDDLGGVSPITIDYINPEHPWPGIDALREITKGRMLSERLCIYEHYCTAEWVDSSLLPLVQKLAKKVYS
ncbi:MAG TPA: 7,8-didemethyl-8-hydroxy-5-deazariboflavin synthase subunit CofG [Methanocorpusculum sp.]|nr:7,8-didemethyl-8-hydroxy-5-deazariboflavin synthase subunit CofG [Methanocorpusculum sp.]